MAEPEGTAEIDSTGEIKAPIDLDASAEAGEALVAEFGGVSDSDTVDDFDDASEGASEEPEEVEPPRRRLVSELLEGQEVVESSRADLQLVAPPLHLETIDAGQPIYQLDLSTDEPHGDIVEPDPAVSPPADVGYRADTACAQDAPDGSGRATVKRMIMERDRQVMAAERDGLGGYELAVNLDELVETLLAAARRD